MDNAKELLEAAEENDVDAVTTRKKMSWRALYIVADDDSVRAPQYSANRRALPHLGDPLEVAARRGISTHTHKNRRGIEAGVLRLHTNNESIYRGHDRT